MEITIPIEGKEPAKGFDYSAMDQDTAKFAETKAAEIWTRHDRMVGLVEQMLKLHKDLPAAKTAHGKTLLQRQIAATDNQIDRLVYDLYELTPEEIAIVEGG